MDRRFQIAYLVLAELLFWALPVMAQINVGDNLNMKLNGDLFVGYSGAYGNQAGSADHSSNLAGDGSLSGFYYSPQFASFSVAPYYGRSQDNSEFQSIGDSSGVNGSASLFGGSHFPGYISFNKTYNSTGEFGLPAGTTGLATNGNNQGFGVSWSALVPDWPTLSASYSIGSSSSSIYGTDAEDTSRIGTLTLRSTYLLDGFHLTAGFLRITTDATFPEFLTGEETTNASSGSSNNFQFSASHATPLHGSFSASFNRLDYSYDYAGGNSSGSSDTLTANWSGQPARRLVLAVSTSYNDNLEGVLAQYVINSGGTPPPSALENSHNFLVTGSALWTIRSGLSVQADVGHQEQYFGGQEYSANQFGGNLNYSVSRPLFGMLNFSFSFFDSATQYGNNGLGFNVGVNLTKKVGHWDIGANFLYAQNVPTLVSVYTTSSYNYGATVSRKVTSHTYWGAGYGSGRSGFTSQPGSGNSSERVFSFLSYRGYTFNGYWSTTSGNAILTASGLVPVPVSVPVGVISPSNLILNNAKSYGISAAVSPTRRLVITGALSKGTGNTLSPGLYTTNETEMLNGLLRYQFRKLYFTAGFTRFNQAIATGGTLPGPAVINSYSFGISRWFNFF